MAGEIYKMNKLDGIIKKIEKLGYISSDIEEKDFIHVAYGCDERYIFPVGISMTSILKYNKNVVFHIFVDYIKKDDIKRIKQTMIQAVCFIYYLDSSILKKLYQNPFWGWATYIRLVAAKELGKKIEKCIYLDADTMCMSEIKTLFKLDMQHKIIGAVADSFLSIPMYKKIMKDFSLTENYFNAGILLIDLNKWQENDISERAFKLLLDNPDKFSSAPDQNVLNYLLKDDVLWLSRNVNVIGRTINDCDKPCFIHFTGPKPWTAWYNSETSKEIDKEYHNIYLNSAWKDEPIWQPENAFQYRQQSKKYIKEKRYFNAIKMQYKYLYLKLIGGLK